MGLDVFISMEFSYEPYAMLDQPWHCAKCGAELELIKSQPCHCFGCDQKAYLDPKLVAACIVSIGRKILLVRRAIEPGLGRWSFPSGYVNRGEKVELAAQREVLEETDLEVEIKFLVGLYSTSGHPVVLAVYDAKIIGGDMKAGEETLDVGMFDIGHLPEMAFEHDEKIIGDWYSKLPD